MKVVACTHTQLIDLDIWIMPNASHVIDFLLDPFFFSGETTGHAVTNLSKVAVTGCGRYRVLAVYLPYCTSLDLPATHWMIGSTLQPPSRTV